MLNYLKLNVLCVLLVSFGDISAIARPSGFQLPFDGRFDIFITSLGDGIRAGTAGFDTTLNFDSLDQIQDTSDDFQKYCLTAFEKKLKSENIDYFDENKALLGKLAFSALDSACKAFVKSLRASLTNDVAYTKELELILYKGDVLDFLVFLKNPGIPRKKLIKEIIRLMNKDKSMTRNEALNRIILHKYNVGKILKDYPDSSEPAIRLLKCFNAWNQPIEC